MARVFLEERTLLDPVMTPVEGILYTATGVRHRKNLTGWQYARAVLWSNLAMFLLVYLIFMLQGI